MNFKILKFSVIKLESEFASACNHAEVKFREIGRPFNFFSFWFFNSGVVISARHFPHPVSIARKIMDESPHCALSGEGALKFAQGLENFDEICEPGDLICDDCPNQHRGIKNMIFACE